LRGESAPGGSAFSADPEARSRIEQLAMNAVRLAEEARGCRVVDVSAQKCGWDITSYTPAVDDRLPEARHIEVKGRVKGATTVTVTKTKSLKAGIRATNTTWPSFSSVKTTLSTVPTTSPIPLRKNPAGVYPQLTTNSRRYLNAPKEFNV